MRCLPDFIPDCALNNDPVLAIAKIFCNVVSCAIEAEVDYLFYNCKGAAPLRQMFIGTGQPNLQLGHTSSSRQLYSAMAISNQSSKQVQSKEKPLTCVVIASKIVPSKADITAIGRLIEQC